MSKHSKRGRNDSCSCGSGLKYKKCYLAKNENCNIFLLSQYKEQEAEVFGFLKECTNEMHSVLVHQCHGYAVPCRVQLLILFTLADILAHFWELYQLKNEGQRVYYPAWLDRFIFTSRNKAYVNSQHLQDLSSENLYDLRNAIIHNYGVPRLSSGYAYVLGSSIKEIHAQYGVISLDILKKRLGKNTLVVLSDEVVNVVWEGARLMFEELVVNSKAKPKEHLLGFDNMYKGLGGRIARGLSTHDGQAILPRNFG